MLGKRRRVSGFTLVELVIVIAVGGVVAVMISSFIARPVQGYVDQMRRADLVDAAESALRRMARDIRRALPNSIRISTDGQALELLNTVDGIRYRDDPLPASASADDVLDFLAADNSFNVLGGFRNVTFGIQPDHFRLVIYNLGLTGADAYSGTGVVTPPGTRITLTDGDPEDRVELDPAFLFTQPSPGQRLYLVDTPVSYVCDTDAARITRYQDYPVHASQASGDSDAELRAAGASAALLTNRVSDCDFVYSPGTSYTAGLVTISLTLSDLASGERIRLLHQVHVSNSP